MTFRFGSWSIGGRVSLLIRGRVSLLIRGRFSLLTFVLFVLQFRANEGKEILFPLVLNATYSYGSSDLQPSSDDDSTVVPLGDKAGLFRSENLTHRKCFCDIQQIWSDGKCNNIGTDVLIPLLKDLYPESDVLSNFIFSSVLIRNVNCSPPMFSVSINEGGLFVLGTGELYHEETDIIFSPENYCFELTEKENVITPIAQVCILPPKVPFCPQKEDANETSSLALNISLGNNFIGLKNLKVVQVQEPKCNDEDDRIVLPLSTNADNLSFHFLSEDAEVLWQPPPPAQLPKVFPSNEYCLLEYSEDSSSLAVTLCYDDPIIRHQKQCNNSVCVRKCCPEHHIFDSTQRKCKPTEPINNSIPLFYDLQNESYVAAPDNLVMEYAFPWCSPKELYIIDPKSNPSDEIFLLSNGSLYISLSKLTMPPSLYCVDTFLDGEVTTTKAISCFLEEVEEKDYCKEVHRILYPVLIVISCAFLAVTLIVYSLIPELHAKLHGKSLLSHVSSLLVAFFCQLIVSWGSKNFSMMGCKIVALSNQVSFLWAFFWLNVMCFDIWWTLKTRSLIPETGERSRRRFALYSMYAWGVPIIITFFTAIMEFLPNSADKSSLILPGFGVRGCWFQDVKSTWLYFHGFTLFLYVLNIFFFCHVAAILIAEQRTTERILNTTRKQHKERVYLYLKLFVVMGITWICEVASWQEGTCEYWIFTDIVNSLQGVMIFFIFMCNKKVYQKMQSKGVPLFRRMKALVRYPSSGDSAVGRRNSSSQRTTQTSDESSSRRLSSSVPSNENHLIRKT